MPDGALGMSIEPCMLDVLSEACTCPVQWEAVNNYILSVDTATRLASLSHGMISR